jgi:hypothetical protein
VVRRDGVVVAELPLTQARRIEVAGALGTSVIEVQPGRARVAADPGPRQYCVRQGWLTQPNAIAICAPSHISLSIAGRTPVMTASPIELTPTADDHRIARYAAAAIALSVVEAAIPCRCRA